MVHDTVSMVQLAVCTTSATSVFVKYNTKFLPTIVVLEAGFSNFMSTLIIHARVGAISTKLAGTVRMLTSTGSKLITHLRE